MSTPAEPTPSNPLNQLARTAHLAGYDTEVTDTGAGSTIHGTMGAWRFRATRYIYGSHGWRVILNRPGWPVQTTTITELRRILKAQTPTDLGKAH